MSRLEVLLRDRDARTFPKGSLTASSLAAHRLRYCLFVLWEEAHGGRAALTARQSRLQRVDRRAGSLPLSMGPHCWSIGLT